jgi:hypothetical protein
VEQTEYFIFRTKYLIFKLNSRLSSKDKSKSQNWVVRRYESDFYVLRSILSLCFGQCLIPVLTPTNKEATWDKKSITLRERSFSRFIRSVLRSKDLCSHPLVMEFLKTDHYLSDQKNGMRDFSKKL